MKGNWKKGIASLPVLTAGLLLCPVKATEWKIELVDSSGNARSASMKIDRDGNAHLAYVVEEGNRNPLKYAFWDARIKKWFVMPVDEQVSTCSLVLDSRQRPHISYVDFGTASGSKLRYAYWDGSTWKKQAIPLNSDVIAYYNSIALDSSDKPSISFYEYRGPRDTEIRIRLRVVTWTGEVWQVRTVDGQEGSGKFNGMVAGSRNTLHLAYANVSANTAGMRYAVWDGKIWHLNVVEGLEQNGGQTVGYSASIVLDKEEDPHLCYSNFSNPLIKYAVRRNSRWQIETVDRISAVGYPDRNSIAVDENGRPFLSYYDAGRGLLKIARKQGTRWLIEVIDADTAGFASSLAIDRGNLWVAYGDDANHGLKIARAKLPPVETSVLRPPAPEK